MNYIIHKMFSNISNEFINYIQYNYNLCSHQELIYKCDLYKSYSAIDVLNIEYIKQYYPTKIIHKYLKLSGHNNLLYIGETICDNIIKIICDKNDTKLLDFMSEYNITNIYIYMLQYCDIQMIKKYVKVEHLEHICPYVYNRDLEIIKLFEDCYHKSNYTDMAIAICNINVDNGIKFIDYYINEINFNNWHLKDVIFSKNKLRNKYHIFKTFR